MRVLVFNCGSSTLKFQLIEVSPAGGTRAKAQRLARGLIDRVGENATCDFAVTGGKSHRGPVAIENHEQAVGEILRWLTRAQDRVVGGIDALGHRVVHGGEEKLIAQDTADLVLMQNQNRSAKVDAS